MSRYEDYKRKALENPEVKAEYNLIQTTATTSPMDVEKFAELLEQFSDDFMAGGRNQGSMQERESIT